MPEFNEFYHIEIDSKIAVADNYDISIAVPFHNSRFQQLSIGLAANTLSDTYSMQSFLPVLNAKIDDVLTGSILDFNYRFKVESRAIAGQQISIEGRYDKDALLFTNYKYEIPNSERIGYHGMVGIFRAKSYFDAIARSLNLTPHLFISHHGDDQNRGWAVKDGSLPKNCNYQQFLSGLFGWRSELPQININCFIRGNDLIAIERGCEADAIDAHFGQVVILSDGSNVVRVPSVQQRKIRTEWSGTVTPPGQSANDIVDREQQPFTGTIAFGDASLHYVNGYLMQRTEGSKTTLYEYLTINNQKYLRSEEMINSDTETASKTEYEYYSSGGIVYLATETRKTGGDASVSPVDYSDANTVITTHSPIGNGYFGLTTEDKDTGDITTALTQGGAASNVSQFMVDKSQDAFNNFNSTISGYLDRILASLLGAPIIDTDFPVDTYFGRSDIVWLAAQTDWLNNKIEERITLEVVNLSHIIDFTDAIIYHEAGYYLESNNISVSTNGIRQTVELVRWY